MKESLADGYDAIGMTNTATKVRSFTDGTSIARFLKQRGWHTLFYNSDTSDPGKENHNKNMLEGYKNKKMYSPNFKPASIPVDGAWLDFGVNSPNFDPKSVDKIKKERIGIINAWGGNHTALLMDGALYEVHQTEDSSPDGKDRLYEKTDFNKWSPEPLNRHKTGVVLLPPFEEKDKKTE